MHRIRTNFILNTFSQVLRIVTPFITTPYVSRVLGVANIGLFSFSYSQQYYFCLVAVLGTVSYGSREIARNRENRKESSVIFWEVELLTVCTSIVATIGWSVVIYFHPENRVLYILLTLYLLASMLDISWLYAGLEQFPYIVGRNVAVKILEVAAIFILVRSSQDLPIYCAIMGGGTLLGNASLWFTIRKYVDHISIKSLRPFRHLRGTLVFFLPTIATTIYTVLDKTMIGVITKSTYENGCYEQATKVVDIAKAITFTSLNAVLSPRSSYLYIKGECEKIKETLMLSVDIMMLLGFGFSFGIISVSARFVPIFFGAGYDGVVLLLKLLPPVILIITISNALGSQYYNPAGLRLQSAIYLFIGSFVNVIFNLILIPKFQSAGAVTATLIAELVISGLYLINCKGYLKTKQIVQICYKKIIAGSAMAAVIFSIYHLTDDDILGLAAMILIGMISYILVLLLLKDSAGCYIGNEMLKRFRRKKRSGG